MRTIIKFADLAAGGGIFKKLETIGDPISQSTSESLLRDWDSHLLSDVHLELAFKNTFSDFGVVLNYPDMALENPAKGHSVAQGRG